MADCPFGPPCSPDYGPQGSWGVLRTITEGEDEAQQATLTKTWTQTVVWTTFVPADGSPGEPLPPVIEFFRGDPTVIEAGDDSTISWSALNALSCEGSGGTGNWGGTMPASGSMSISSISDTTTFFLSCTGDGGTTDATPVTVTAEPSQNYPTDVETSGMVEVTPSVSTRYRLTCNGPGGTTTEDVTVSVDASPMPECDPRAFAESEVQVQNAYIGYYGRPTDIPGLEYWSQRYENEGGSLDAIIDAFGNSEEYVSEFGGLSYEQQVDKLYQQMFGRPADQAGSDFYVGELEAGRLTVQSVALDILNGAQGDDAVVLNNRLTVSEHFATVIEDLGLDYVEGADTLLPPVYTDSDADAQCRRVNDALR